MYSYMEKQDGGDLKNKVKNLLGCKQMKYRNRDTIMDKIYSF